MERRGQTGRGLGWPWTHTTGSRSRLGWPGKGAAPTQPSSLALPSSESRPTTEHRTTEHRATESPAQPANDGDEALEVSRETLNDPDGGLRGAAVRRLANDDDLRADGGVSRETVSSTTQEVVEAAQSLTPRAEPVVEDDSTPLADAIALDVRRRSTLVGAPLPRPSATRVLTVANQKGGVGKTTSAVNIAAALAQSGMKVLVVDLDPQGNASTALGVEHRAGIDSIYDVLVDGMSMSAVVVESPTVAGLFCAPSTIDLAGAEIELVSLVAREGRLAKALEAHLAEAAYDYVFIDCPPSLGLLTVNAFVAAREVFIPIQCEYYALEGLSQLLRNVELIRTHLNPRLEVSTILLTMFDGRTRLSAQVADEVRQHFPVQTLRTTIPRSVRVSEAPSYAETVMTYDPLSSGALAYLEAASQIAHRDAGSTTEGARS